jgi:uncharacterized protein (TIGR02246 family)
LIHRQLGCLLGVLLLATVAFSQSPQASGGTETAIAALENQWLQAQRTNNPDLVAPILADKFVYTDGDGKLDTKAAMLADKSVKWHSVDYENVQIAVYGDTAIVTGEFVGKGTDSSGKAINDHSRYTDTWVKMPNGKWQCVASQDTPIKT